MKETDASTTVGDLSTGDDLVQQLGEVTAINTAEVEQTLWDRVRVLVFPNSQSNCKRTLASPAK